MTTGRDALRAISMAARTPSPGAWSTPSNSLSRRSISSAIVATARSAAAAVRPYANTEGPQWWMSAAGKPAVTVRLATSPPSRSSRIAMIVCMGSVVVHCHVIGMMNGIWRNAL